jgi:outer membrane protein assembly factor BamB
VTGYTSPSPVSDGKNVYLVTGNGVAACYDLDGTRQWITYVAKPLEGWGFSTSPLIADGKLLVSLVAAAIDLKTGKVLWNHAPYRRIPWGTGCVITVGGEKLWLTPDGMIYRISDGKKLAEKQAYTQYNGLIQADGVVYFVQNKGTAVTLPAKAEEGMKLTPKYTFKMDKNRYYASPVLYDGRIYAITRYCQMTITDAATGKELSTRKVKELQVKGVDIYPSICVAGGRIFNSNDEGTTLVMTPGDEPSIEETNSLEPFRSTPIFQGGRMYIRGLKHLWCIGK